MQRSRESMKYMKIAQVAPLVESVPPRLYGGTERIVSYLTEELVGLGHDVTLFASGDSITSAELVPCCARALRLDPAVSDINPPVMRLFNRFTNAPRSLALFNFTSVCSPFPFSARCQLGR